MVLFDVPPLLWSGVPLGVLVGFAWWRGRVPAKVYGLVGLVLWVGNVWFAGWVSGLIVLLAGLLLFVAGVGVGLRRRTVFALTAAGLGLPLVGWLLLAPGAAAAAGVSGWRLRRRYGEGYLSMVTGETMAGLGYFGGLFGMFRPDFSRVPVEEGAAVPVRGVDLLRWVAAGAALSWLGVVVFWLLGQFWG